MVFESIGALLVMLLVSEFYFVKCLDFSEAKFDEISGELDKPNNWTNELFNIYKQLRLTVSLRFLFSACRFTTLNGLSWCNSFVNL